MDHIGFGPACALLLLIQCERTQEIQSNDTGIYKTGENISLTIWYEGTPSAIFWNYNGSPLVIRAEVYNYISPRFDGRTILKEDGSLLIKTTTKDDAGDYTVNVATSFLPGTGSFQVKFYDVIQNVTVQQNPAIVDVNTPLVNLSCKALSGSGSVTWQKDGQPVNSVSTHILDQDLQILQPNGTFSGTYSCNMSNPVSWNVGSIKLTVYYPVTNVAVTHSPQTVSEMTSLVNLSCNASSGNIETVTWMKDGQPIDNTYKLLDGNQTLQIIQPNRTFSGNYSCNISNPVDWCYDFHQLRVYDPVETVKVTQSPEKVTNTSPFAVLSCSASSGYIEEVTWTKDGQSVISIDAYILLTGNRTLQITKPNENFNGIYTCKMSNAAYSGLGSINLTVSYPVTSVTVTHSPQTVSEMTSLVNLSCNASSGNMEAVTWMKDGQPIDNTYKLLDGNQTLQIIQPNRTFSGNYSCNIFIQATMNQTPADWYFAFHQLRVYDPVETVKVTQSPEKVTNTSPFAVLSCSASSGYIEEVTWTKDGQSVISKDAYNLLTGNRTLQITKPNENFNGIYTCKMSNAVYSGLGSINLTVSYPVTNVAVTHSPQTVSEMTSLVNLSCNASGGNIEAVTWMKDGQPIDNTYKLLDGNQTLQIIQPNRTFSGNYSCNIFNQANWYFDFHQLRVYDPVETVKVTQSPEKVTKRSPWVNLSCSASSGYIEEVTWTKDGQSVISIDAYILLNGNRTLQIIKPNENFNGIYTCKMSNAVYSGLGSINLTVSCK